MRPIKGCLLAHVAALLALICAAGAAAQTTTSPPPPPAPTGDIRGDLQLFRRQIVEADVSYSPAGRAEARARLRELEGRLDHLDALQVEIELCRITALANNAHSACLRPFPAAAVGLGFYPLEGGLYVFSAPAADDDLVGGRLLAIDGMPIDEARLKVRSLQGGRAGWRDIRTSYAYGRPAVLQALGVAKTPDAALYRIGLPGGRVVERRLAASDQPPAGPFTRIMTAEQTPWIWRDMADVYRWRDAPEHGAIIVQLRSNVDLPGQSLGAFLGEVERQRAALGRKTVIIDMRTNTGGDLMLSREAFAAWPARVGPGARFLVLLGPQSLSAALANAAYLKQAGGAEVTILGQSPGDGMTFFSEGPNVTLPGTGLVIRQALERDDLKDGCRPYADCFAALAQPGGPTATPADRERFFKRMPVAVASLEPDTPVAASIADYLEGHDAVLDRALEMAAPCPSVSRPAACEAETRALAGPVPGSV